MCTVSWIPRAAGGFALTANRDEAPARSSRDLVRLELQGQTLCFPRDEGAGGTWIAMSDAGRVACVLNGAFEPHAPRPPYRRSRGLMVLDSFHFARADDFFARYAFVGMEPFTLIIAEGASLWEARWDGHRLYRRRLDPARPHLWSSVTLYDAEARARRRRWFEEWLRKQPEPTPEDILHFHRCGGEPDPWNGFVMNRHGRVCTLSITQVVGTPGRLHMTHRDLLRQTLRRDALLLRRKTHPCPQPTQTNLPK